MQNIFQRNSIVIKQHRIKSKDKATLITAVVIDLLVSVGYYRLTGKNAFCLCLVLNISSIHLKSVCSKLSSCKMFVSFVWLPLFKMKKANYCIFLWIFEQFFSKEREIGAARCPWIKIV